MTVLTEVYDAFTVTVRSRSVTDLERASRAAAWTVKELLFHQLLDAQRALMALATPVPGPADVDEATYWRPWRPSEGDGGTAHAQFVVCAAAAYDGAEGLVQQWADTSAAAARAAAAADPDGFVATQGHVIAVPDFVSTLVVEATVHLLDAWGEPPAGALDHTAMVLERIHGGPLPTAATTLDTVLEATGRLSSSHPAYPLLG